MSQFYALMHDYTVKYIPLKEDITTEIKNIFIKGGAILKPEGIEEDIFDGDIISRRGENMSIMNYQKILLASQTTKLIYPNIILMKIHPEVSFIMMRESFTFKLLIKRTYYNVK